MKKDDIESALAFTMDEGTGGPASGELSVADPDARRDQAPGMPGAFHQASRAAAVGGLCQLVQVHEPSGNDGPLTIHRELLHTYPQLAMPKGGAEDWIEYLRREVYEPNRRNTDMDGIRAAGPDFQFRFASEPLIQLTVPEVLAKGGGPIYGQVPRWNGTDAYIELTPMEAKRLLKS